MSPRLRGPRNIDDMLRRLRGEDKAAKRYKIEPYEDFAERLARMSEQLRLRRENRGKPEGKEAEKQIAVEKRRARKAQHRWLWQTLRRRAHTQDGLRERLSFFWADHFTARGKVNIMKRASAPYVESAIRPHVNGNFADMLKAVLAQPVMLQYLDQKYSMGPDSRVGLLPASRKKGRGLNENLARELLELHTLGVDGNYSQTDVFELAELLTGLTYTPQGSFQFRGDYAQPGAEHVLGVDYGGGDATLADVHAVLERLALHPDTARHLATKLAVHFVSDAPDPMLIAHLEARYNSSGGNLGAMTEALLEHPAAWSPEPGNVKQPIDFVGSALRALNVSNEAINVNDWKRIRELVAVPLRLMGQTWEEPVGPDGWPEDDSAWITPQRFAARVGWAMSAPTIFSPSLPDPREFVVGALGTRASDEVLFAARAAEDRATGVGLVLASPAFQRM
nr:DUF1800 domain-containing protein [Lentibacter algarum]